LKKVSIPSVHEMTVREAAVFPQELALAKPVAHDKLAFNPFFNGLFGAGKVFRERLARENGGSSGR
jgi:hypothetical protein